MIHVPFSFLVSQVCLYLMNSMDLKDGEAKDTFGIFLINSVLPLLVAIVSFSIYRTSVNLYLSKLSEAMS